MTESFNKCIVMHESVTVIHYLLHNTVNEVGSLDQVQLE